MTVVTVVVVVVVGGGVDVVLVVFEGRTLRNDQVVYSSNIDFRILTNGVWP